MSLLADALNQLLDACPEVGVAAPLETGDFLFPAAMADTAAKPATTLELASGSSIET